MVGPDWGARTWMDGGNDYGYPPRIHSRTQ